MAEILEELVDRKIISDSTVSLAPRKVVSYFSRGGVEHYPPIKCGRIDELGLREVISPAINIGRCKL